MNLVSAHHTSLVVERQKLAAILISNSSQAIIGLFNNFNLESALQKQGSDHNRSIRKLSAQSIEKFPVAVHILLVKPILVQVIAAYLNIDELDLLVLLEGVDEALVDAILYVLNLVAANAKIENVRVLVDAEVSASGLEALHEIGSQKCSGVLARITGDERQVGVVMGIVRSLLEHVGCSLQT
jgi:hypothetical protein